MPSEKRKARKQNYFKAAKQSRRHQQGRVLQEGMRGFLLTCNNRERETVREAYNILNEFADKLFGPEHAKSEEDGGSGKEEEEDDIDAAFDKEKSELAEVKAKNSSGERRFQVVESGARNCVFIKTSLAEPERLATDIIDTIIETGVARARYILRMVPVLGTCKAHEKNIEELAKEVLAGVFPEGTSASYSILFKTRNNGSLGRDDLIKLVGSVVRDLPGETSVDLKTPDVAIVVEIVRSVCCLGVARQYYGARRKFNLVELVRQEEGEDGDEKVAGENAEPTLEQAGENMEDVKPKHELKEESESTEKADENVKDIKPKLEEAESTEKAAVEVFSEEGGGESEAVGRD